VSVARRAFALDAIVPAVGPIGCCA
jgi:hypothetical protein